MPPRSPRSRIIRRIQNQGIRHRFHRHARNDRARTHHQSPSLQDDRRKRYFHAYRACPISMDIARTSIRSHLDSSRSSISRSHRGRRRIAKEPIRSTSRRFRRTPDAPARRTHLPRCPKTMGCRPKSTSQHRAQNDTNPRNRIRRLKTRNRRRHPRPRRHDAHHLQAPRWSQNRNDTHAARCQITSCNTLYLVASRLRHELRLLRHGNPRFAPQSHR